MQYKITKDNNIKKISAAAQGDRKFQIFLSGSEALQSQLVGEPNIWNVRVWDSSWIFVLFRIFWWICDFIKMNLHNLTHRWFFCEAIATHKPGNDHVLNGQWSWINVLGVQAGVNLFYINISVILCKSDRNILIIIIIWLTKIFN